MYDTAVAMAKRLLVDSIWKSANLEGLGTTFPKTEAILANAPTNTKAEEVLFIVNMKRAWEFLLDNIDADNNIALLREYNKIACNTLVYNAGELRNIPVGIGGTSWLPEIPQAGVIIDSLKELEKIHDPVTKALRYFCYVARTQMFTDGNKRVAQLIANKILIQYNVGIFQIPLEHLEKFKTILLSFYETNDYTELLEFLKTTCIREVQLPIEDNKIYESIPESTRHMYGNSKTEIVENFKRQYNI